MSLEDEFRNWMEHKSKDDGTHYLPRTIYRYSRALKIFPRESIFKSVVPYESIFLVTDYEEMNAVDMAIRAADGFSEFDHSHGRGDFSAALKLYLQYLQAREALSINSICSFVPTYLSIEYAVSLIANPFLILTGTSGSGKTRLALRLAHQFGQMADEKQSRAVLVPVGSDWTDNRYVMGYVNHLVKVDGKSVYQTTPVVDLLLKANLPENRRLPFFLILDEMNLSHVERYFSDFLSKMESRDRVVFHSESQPLPGSGGVAVPPSIERIPQNVFVIGTVNVDETTYMFSPKVLDRAQVIEFRVSPEQADAYLKSGGRDGGVMPEPDDVSAGNFLDLALRARGLAEPPLEESASMEPLRDALGRLFKLMHANRMEFAYRTMNEILRYACVSVAIAEDKAKWSWKDCFDVQVLQKVLPKLHGNRKRMEPVLISLVKLCENGLTEADKAICKTELDKTPSVGRIPKPAGDQSVEDAVTFRRSYEKLCDMLDAVRRDQYVSFIQ